MKFKTGFVVQLVNQTPKKKRYFIHILKLTAASHFKKQKNGDSMEITSTVIFPKTFFCHLKKHHLAATGQNHINQIILLNKRSQNAYL